MGRARKILEDEAPGSTLVIHVQDRSTDFLKPIYEGKGYPVISDRMRPQELLEAVEQYSRVFMLGHGGPSGLFGVPTDERFGQALRKKRDGLYVWCNADAYAHRNKLSGIVTGMFISEVLEARIFGIEATQAEIDLSNSFFSKVVRAYLDDSTPPSSVRQCYTHATCKITRFNNERIYVFEDGVPTPPLHSTSLAHVQPAKPWSASLDPFSYLQKFPDEEADELDWEKRQDWWAAVEDLVAKSGLTEEDFEDWQEILLQAYEDKQSPEEAVELLSSYRTAWYS